MSETANPAALGSVSLWLADLDRTADALEAIDEGSPLLDDHERKELEPRAATPEGRRRLTARRALRLLIEHRFGALWRGRPLLRGPHGKPRLEGHEGDFSLAHAGSLALIGTTDGGCLGVDLELPRTLRFTGARADALMRAASRIAIDPAAIDGPLSAWVRLEAVAKATGLGIGRVLETLGARSGGEAGAASAPGNWPRAEGIDLSPLELGASVGEGSPAAVALHSVAAALARSQRGGPAPAARRLPADRAALMALRAGEPPA